MAPLGLLLLLALALTGCVSKATADAQARAAFLAGQQQALAHLQQTQGPSITISGQVKNSTVPWNQDLTLAKAIVAAGYFGPDPTEIVIVRSGQETRVDPKQLLNNEDVPLDSGDLIRIQ
jgi:protein involved in polysaccharide export with SLBB domain